MEAALEAIVDEIIENLLVFLEDDNLVECSVVINFKSKTNIPGRYELRNASTLIEFIQYLKILNKQQILSATNDRNQIQPDEIDLD